jgi:putative NADPH-quinone reductase
MVPRMNILILNGHPDPAAERLCSALAAAYAKGARGAGHEVRQIDVGGLSFALLRTARDFAQAPRDPDILAAREALLWARHLVFVYPLWLGGPPALLKAFMECVACGDFLIGSGGGSMPKGKLAGRSARMVVTMGMPAFVYRIWFRAHGTRAFGKGILRMAGISPVRTSYIGNVGNVAERCRRWVGRMHALGARAL